MSKPIYKKIAAHVKSKKHHRKLKSLRKQEEEDVDQPHSKRERLGQESEQDLAQESSDAENQPKKTESASS